MPRALKSPPEKRVENREWPTRYRGPLAIHAGKSRAWLQLHKPYAAVGRPEIVQDRRYGIDVAEMAFGAVVGTARLIDCLHIDEILSGACDERYPWIRSHAHCEGEWCFVLDDAKRLAEPVPFRGQLGFFDVPDELLKAAA